MGLPLSQTYSNQQNQFLFYMNNQEWDTATPNFDPCAENSITAHQHLDVISAFDERRYYVEESAVLCSVKSFQRDAPANIAFLIFQEFPLSNWSTLLISFRFPTFSSYLLC